MGTFIVLIIVLAVVGLVIWKMVKDKKAGKSASCSYCTGNCFGCDPNPNQKSRTRRKS